jgi:1-acyl-sn-glycerol-3-phosphate acyltransferase
MASLAWGWGRAARPAGEWRGRRFGISFNAMQRLLSLWIWLVTGLVATLFLPWVAVVWLFTVGDPGRYAAGRWFRRAAVTAVALNPLWKFRTSGVRIRDPRRPYVAVSNHESFADIFLLSHLPWEMKWLSKDAIFKIPIMGWMMKLAGDIEVHRGDARSRHEALEQCRDRLLKKVSVMIMPEGTRSPDGRLLPFKDGAFRLAVELGLPILPIAVAGTRDAMPKGSLLFNRAVAEARVLQPVETAGMALADVPLLRERVREMIEEARDALFREMGAPPRPAMAR